MKRPDLIELTLSLYLFMAEWGRMGQRFPEAFAYVKTLSLESFREEVRRATEWSMSRAAKNRLREVVRFWRHEEPEENPRAREIKQISWVGQPPGDEDAPDPPEDFDEPSIFVSL